MCRPERCLAARCSLEQEQEEEQWLEEAGLDPDPDSGSSLRQVGTIGPTVLDSAAVGFVVQLAELAELAVHRKLG